VAVAWFAGLRREQLPAGVLASLRSLLTKRAPTHASVWTSRPEIR